MRNPSHDRMVRIRSYGLRLLIVAVKLLCVYSLSQEDAAFFYQQF
jgi:hypothetical protein